MVLSSRIDTLEGITEEPIFPLFYYVGNYVYIYKLFDGYIFCSIVSPENLEQFKERYLSKAYQLTENYCDYKDPIVTNIPEENPNA